MKPLSLSEIKLGPKARRIRDDVLSKCQYTVDVELIQNRVVQLHLREGHLFPKLVPLALIRLPVNRTLVQERLVDTIKPLALPPNDVFEVPPLLFNIALPIPSTRP